MQAHVACSAHVAATQMQDDGDAGGGGGAMAWPTSSAALRRCVCCLRQSKEGDAWVVAPQNDRCMGTKKRVGVILMTHTSDAR
jgi:hypothetical protein